MFIELTVQLREKPELGTAKVQCFYHDVEGGVRLDRELDGFVSWNIDKLKIVDQKSFNLHQKETPIRPWWAWANE